MKTPTHYSVFVHRLYDKGEPKLGGLDILLKGLSFKNSKIDIVEFPLIARQYNYFRINFNKYSQNETIEQSKFISHIAPFVYLQEFVYACYYTFFKSKKREILITSDPLTSLFGIVLRKFGLYKKLYYHCIDYSTDRFKNRLANSIYNFLLKRTLKSADLVGCVTRRTFDILTKLNLRELKYVPNSPSMSEYANYFVSYDKRTTNKIVLTVAGLSDKYRILELVDIMADVAKKIPSVKLYILGSPNYDTEYASKVKAEIINKKLDDNIILTGQLSREENIKMLADAMIGVAYYNNKYTHVTYGDSLKIREYAALGLAIVSDSVTPTSIEMRDSEAGIVEDDYTKVAQTLIALLSDTIRLHKLYESSLNWAKQLDKDLILNNLLTSFKYD